MIFRKSLAFLALFFASSADIVLAATYPPPSTNTQSLPVFLADPVTGAATPGGGNPTGTAGAPNAAVTSVQGVAGGTPQPTTTTPGTRVLVPLTVSTVTTGGTAVTALTAGQRSAGGWIYNPSVATVNLCLNEISTATGTTSSGNTYCIIPGQTTQLTPSGNAVSVVTSDSAHNFAGYGLQ